jgi:hypothetical protein
VELDKTMIKPLKWSPEMQPNGRCAYNHCTANAPIGRFVLVWHAWKDDTIIMAHETPWGPWVNPQWETVEEAKAACQNEYIRRVSECLEVVIA